MNNHLEKGLFIIEKDSKHLSILPNDVILRIHEIDQLETDFVMTKKTHDFLLYKTPCINFTYSLIIILFTNKNYIEINKIK